MTPWRVGHLNLALWCARHVPQWLRYWVCIDCWAKATTGPWSHTIAPELTVGEMLQRMEKP